MIDKRQEGHVICQHSIYGAL